MNEEVDRLVKETINNYYDETQIISWENKVLLAMKQNYEKDPTTENNKDWMEFSDSVIQRRGWLTRSWVSKEKVLEMFP